MNKLYVINMKMNLTLDEIQKYLNEIKYQKMDNIIFCPSSIYIPYFLNNKLQVGIQNISKYENGPYTGQISAIQASSLGVKYALIGHSEVIKYFNEDAITINDKVKICIQNKITPILCIGELKEDNILNVKKILEQQINLYLKNINNIEKIIIAYEPAWMIGSHNEVNVNQIENIITFIKKVLKKYKINDIMILYGGNLNKNNIKSISFIENLDGFLIGKSALDVDHFLDIIGVA